MRTSRISSFWLALGLLGLFASFVGCSGSVQPDGCEHAGTHYQLGDSFKDVCNYCSCGRDGVSCTAAACNCVDDAGVSYAPWQQVSDKCVCSADGHIRCDLVEPPANCEKVVPEMNAALASAQSCQAAADCGQPIPGSSCGCTRDLVARKNADLKQYLELRAAARESGCVDEGISTCDCPNADGFACINQVCTWNYVSVEPEPTCETYEPGELCVRGTPTADGEQIAAGDPLRVSARSVGCLSSSCSKVMEASCTIASGSSFEVEAKFCVADTAKPGQACTADCGTAHADCSFGQPLSAGEHQVKLGSLAVAFQVPAKLPVGGLCARTH